jgi:uncharacterized protein (DUF58 family)
MFLFGILFGGVVLWLLAHYIVKSLFLNRWFYLGGAVSAILFLLSYFIPVLKPVSQVIFWLFIALVIFDIIFVFAFNRVPSAKRYIADRLSNGDPNPVFILIKNNYPFAVRMEVIDELPLQFQERHHFFKQTFGPGQEKKFAYSLRPVERGAYQFGNIIIYISSLLNIVSRRYTAEEEKTIPVYPSFLQMRKYELMAHSAQIQEMGSKRMRKIGHSMEISAI